MVPCRIIPQVLYQHCVHEIELSIPQVFVVEVRQQPLPIRPSVVVLRICFEGCLDKRELRAWFADDHEQEPAVVPHLVGFEILHCQLVHELELNVKRRFDSEKSFVSVLPVRAWHGKSWHLNNRDSIRTMPNNGLGSVG